MKKQVKDIIAEADKALGIEWIKFVENGYKHTTEQLEKLYKLMNENNLEDENEKDI